MENIKLKKFLEDNHGYIATKDFKKIGISKTLIPKLLDKKILRKVAYGLYIDNNLIEAAHSAYIGSFNEKAIFYLQTRGITREKIS